MYEEILAKLNQLSSGRWCTVEYHDRVVSALKDEREALRAQLAEARAEIASLHDDRATSQEHDHQYSTRPVRVRFDCTMEDMYEAWKNTSLPAYAEFALDYLATRAVIDVPEDEDNDPDALTVAYMCGRKDGQRDTRNDLRDRQRECYERVQESTLAVLSGIDSDCNIRELCSEAHDYALEAARTLPARLAELDAALKGGE